MFIGNLNSVGNMPIGGGGFPNEYSVLTDGVDEWVDCGVVSALNATQNFSISCWVKANTSADGEILGTFTSAGNMIGLNFAVSSNVISISVRNGPVTYSSHSATLNTGQWYHVVMVFDGTQGTATDRIKAYLDGSNVARSGGSGTNPTTSNTSTKSFDIGGLRDASVYRDVYMDEVAIFDYSLDASQVSSIYNSGVPTDLDNTSGVTAPIHWWRMGDGDTYPTITDVGTTGGNNGTMTNMEAGDITADTP
jgi:hypothetical protein